MRRWQILSLLFHFIHSGIVLFSITGWILPSTRPYHLIACCVITLSWYGLGRYHYPGYCILTDYHFRVLRRMQVEPGSQSYIQYLFDTLTPFRIPSKTLDHWVVFLFFSAFACSSILSITPFIDHLIA